MRPETSERTTKTSPPPQASPARSVAGKAPSSPRGGKANSGCAAPNPTNSRAEDFISPPDFEDTGASNMGASTEDAGRSEILVPPVLEKKKKKRTASSPSKTGPATSSPVKDVPAPPPAPPVKPAPAPQQTPPEGAIITAQQLTAAVTAATAPPSGSQPLMLHAGRAAVSAGEKASAQLGRIVELTRGDADLGSLREYVEKWNRADLSPATCGLGKDKLPVVDNSGPRSTAQHLGRLRRAMKEFDTTWHDANANVVVSLLLPTFFLYTDAGF